VTTTAVFASRIFSTTCDSGRFKAMVLVREDSLRELETPIATNTGKEYNSSALRLVRFGNRLVVISFVDTGITISFITRLIAYAFPHKKSLGNYEI
jgi:hypothetical protein